MCTKSLNRKGGGVDRSLGRLLELSWPCQCRGKVWKLGLVWICVRRAGIIISRVGFWDMLERVEVGVEGMSGRVCLSEIAKDKEGLLDHRWGTAGCV